MNRLLTALLALIYGTIAHGQTASPQALEAPTKNPPQAQVQASPQQVQIQRDIVPQTQYVQAAPVQFDIVQTPVYQVQTVAYAPQQVVVQRAVVGCAASGVGCGVNRGANVVVSHNVGLGVSHNVVVNHNVGVGANVGVGRGILRRGNRQVTKTRTVTRSR